MGCRGLELQPLRSAAAAAAAGEDRNDSGGWLPPGVSTVLRLATTAGEDRNPFAGRSHRLRLVDLRLATTVGEDRNSGRVNIITGPYRTCARPPRRARIVSTVM